MSRIKNLKGQKFDRLEVIEFGGKYRNRYAMWKCKCVCGNIIICRASGLQSGQTTSCGCYRDKLRFKHGHSKNRKQTGIYMSWRDMKQRCTNPNTKARS